MPDQTTFEVTVQSRWIWLTLGVVGTIIVGKILTVSGNSPL